MIKSNGAKAALTEWIIHFLKNKDLIHRKIVSIEKDRHNFDIYVKYKEKEEFFIIEPLIEDIKNILNKLKEDIHYGLVLFNNKMNLDLVIENWKSLLEFPNLTLYFVNPHSKLDKKWILRPAVHQKICEESSLKTGLKSMFAMVEPISKEEVIKTDTKSTS